MHYNYCPLCGNKLIAKQAGDDGLVPYCIHCCKYWFDSFHSCVIVLVANEYNEIALLQQSYLSDKYSTFVAGYMAPGENAETTARREVKEEIGLDLKFLKLEGTYWFEEKGLLMIGFIAYTLKQDFILSKEVDSATWVPYKLAPDYFFPNKPGNAAHALYRKYIETIENENT